MHLRAPTLHPGLMTDLYHPDAAYVAWRAGHNGLTTFDLYTRTTPFGGAYLLVAGVEAALAFVQAFRYTPEELQFLAQIRDYDSAFLDELATLCFTGEILAFSEGSIAFPNEPMLRVTAPFREALLIESGVLQAMNLATLIATKAARVVYAAEQGHPRRIAEFAFRRAQEPFTVARSSSIGGCASTSFLNAAFAWHLPATGTVPHALIEIFPSEEDAFEAIAVAYNRYTLLLDTYDPRHAIHTAIEVARRTQETLGHTLAAVRLDSGDLLGDSLYVREQLDTAGFTHVRVEDVIQLEHEPSPEHYQRLLRPVMCNGEIFPGSLPPLSEIRELAQCQLHMLPEPYRALVAEHPYPIRFSEGLQAVRKQAVSLVGNMLA